MPATKAKRRHATMACVSCRESKIKCDGGEPACSHCASRNRECRYQAFDKRKLPLRVAIELLSSRVSQLCCFMRDNGLQPPPMPQEKDTALKKVFEVLGLADINSTLTQNVASVSEQSLSQNKGTATSVLNPLPGLGQAEQHPIGFTDSRASQDLPALSLAVEPGSENLTSYHNFPTIGTDGPENLSWPLATGTGFVQSHDAPFNTTLEEISEPIDPNLADDDDTLVEESNSPESVEGLVDELSDRVGTLQIGPGGKTQFYGPTSTFNLAEMLATGHTETRLAQHDALECLSRFGGHKPVPAALEDHLTNLYFSWQDPSFHVVDRRMYEQAKAKWYAMGDTPYYSESIRHAICALGASYEARYHPNFVTFPISMVDFFEDRAKALLEAELDCPCIATVQALVICSSLEVGSGREARGWLYSGMAIRLAFNLALHVDMSSYVSSGVITPADADLRRVVFWAAYTVDHQLGFHLGRPFRTNMEDVTVGKPRQNANPKESEAWFPYASPNSTYAGTGVPDCMEAVCEEQINLCEIMAPCGDFLYGTSSISKTVLQRLNVEVVTKLLNWKTNLAQPLQLNLDDDSSIPYTPQVLLLHMQYHQNIIYAHRPWMSKSHTGIQPQPPQGPGHNHARGMCIQSATAIAKIIAMYEKRYTLRRIHTKAVGFTSSAVLLLLFAGVTRFSGQSQGQTSRGRNENQVHLSTCFRALDEFAVCWPSAAKAKNLLLRLQRRWEIRTRSGEGAWPGSESVSGPGQPGFGFGEPGSDAIGTSYGTATAEHQQDIDMPADMDWMLMPDGISPSDSRAADLYTLLSNPITIHPERGSI